MHGFLIAVFTAAAFVASFNISFLDDWSKNMKLFSRFMLFVGINIMGQVVIWLAYFAFNFMIYLDGVGH